MNLRRKERGDGAIDVSSFADIAFLLIIFFILTTTFTKIAGNYMEIPSGSTEKSEEEQKQLTVTLSSDSIMYGEDEESLEIEDLRAALEKEGFGKKKPDDRMVILEASGDVPYERYFQVVMAISDAGGVLTLIDYEGDEAGTE